MLYYMREVALRVFLVVFHQIEDLQSVHDFVVRNPSFTRVICVFYGTL